VSEGLRYSKQYDQNIHYWDLRLYFSNYFIGVAVWHRPFALAADIMAFAAQSTAPQADVSEVDGAERPTGTYAVGDRSRVSPILHVVPPDRSLWLHPEDLADSPVNQTLSLRARADGINWLPKEHLQPVPLIEWLRPLHESV
jgi:hypothetical protein